MVRTFVLFGALAGLISVALGAFGVHGLRAYFDANPAARSSFDTAVQYQQLHALALLAAAWASDRFAGRWPRIAGIAFAVGIGVFCGALYALSLLGWRWMGAVAPIGGAAFLLGWAALFWSAWQDKGREGRN